MYSLKDLSGVEHLNIKSSRVTTPDPPKKRKEDFRKKKRMEKLLLGGNHNSTAVLIIVESTQVLKGHPLSNNKDVAQIYVYFIIICNEYHIVYK